MFYNLKAKLLTELKRYDEVLKWFHIKLYLYFSIATINK